MNVVNLTYVLPHVIRLAIICPVFAHERQPDRPKDVARLPILIS